MLCARTTHVSSSTGPSLTAASNASTSVALHFRECRGVWSGDVRARFSFHQRPWTGPAGGAPAWPCHSPCLSMPARPLARIALECVANDLQPATGGCGGGCVRPVLANARARLNPSFLARWRVRGRPAVRGPTAVGSVGRGEGRRRAPPTRPGAAHSQELLPGAICRSERASERAERAGPGGGQTRTRACHATPAPIAA